jgi:triphosphoribosyl-dephospho-CoA synthase
VLLGHILILAPLVASASICLRAEKLRFSDFKSICIKIIDDASIDDTIRLYNAIRISNPGGLGRIDKYDIYDDNSLKSIRRDEIKLKKIFELSKEYDLISSEYSTGFKIILNEGFNYYREIYNKYNDINIATVNTYFKILSIYPDTLIIRKSGLEAAKMVSNKASEILEIGGISSDKGMQLAHNLDEYLQESNGKMNPGTTADILAGIIFCSLIFGLKF